ncbi:carboxymuconolactone decarboxylase family protein [Lentzea indica]|uniref:carboxymuconolactone decarboxylase family protein n=1 Tax=Lentzea indica TaxID=2604800 RepID=UPI0028AC4B28|nr:peroxidase-related enzyme [Lentzea indica]
MIGLLTYRPETAKPIADLANTLLRSPGSLSRGERELIAATVSHGNECRFCANSHSAIAAHELDDRPLVDQVLADPAEAPVSGKLRALLHIAEQVRVSGKAVTPDHIAVARSAGATDLEIHDTVLIAAMFCMMNRYVDGLGTFAPLDPAGYAEAAKSIAANGYGA